MLHATALFSVLMVALVGDAPDKSHDFKAYEQLKANAGKGSQAQVKLALWCESHGLNAERVKHLAQAVLSDPKNVTARGLLGLVAFGGRWESTNKIGDRVTADQTLEAKRTEYEQRRSKLTAEEIKSQQAADRLEESGNISAAYSARLRSNRRLAPAHVELARWCETHDLKAEATAHITMALHLDPYRRLGWTHLGYVKRNGQWTSRDQATADELEAREQKHADRTWEPLLKKWTSLLRDQRRHEEGENLLATVTDRRAVPSILKLFPLDRPEADQLLRVSLLGQVDDPSSSRAIADQAVSTRFDSVRGTAIKILKKRPLRDYAGKLVEMIHGAIRYEVRPVLGPDSRGALAIDAPRFRMLRTYDVPPAFELASTFRGYVGYDDDGVPMVVQGIDLDYMRNGNPLAIATRFQEIKIRTANMLAEAALAAQRQMAADIDTIEMANYRARVGNASIIPILKSAAGASPSLGDDEDAWRGWWYDQLGYRYQASPKPTFGQEVVPEYLPYSVQTCFAAGTPVRTLHGARSIEAIQIGDQVLSQDGATGALSFQPVVFVHRNSPDKTLRIKLSDGQYVVCSVYHRFWRANLGWAQARELKPGDALRSLDGVVRVDSIAPDAVQPLYNLDVACSRTFFAGQTSLLVHDNTLPDHRLKPFDELPVAEVSQRAE
jgi:Pretoxin HINT domain